MRVMSSSGGAPLLILLVFLLPGLALSCGHIRPAPQDFHPKEYSPVTIEQLQAPRQAGLVSGQKVRVTGYFWQYLDYDPRLAANYLTMARQPLAWSRLRWASLYRTLSMQGYYDRLALTREEQLRLRLKRLEKVEVFGELAPWGFGALYLQAHRVQRLEGEEGPAGQGQTAPEAEGKETPAL